MIPKKVTRGEKPKRKIVVSTLEMKKGLSQSGKVVHVYRTWLLNIPPTIIIDWLLYKFYVCTIVNKKIQLLKLNILVLSLFANMIFWNRHFKYFILFPVNASCCVNYIYLFIKTVTTQRFNELRL
jgi:hypothetical protein